MSAARFFQGPECGRLPGAAEAIHIVILCIDTYNIHMHKSMRTSGTPMNTCGPWDIFHVGCGGWWHQDGDKSAGFSIFRVDRAAAEPSATPYTLPHPFPPVCTHVYVCLCMWLGGWIDVCVSGGAQQGWHAARVYQRAAAAQVLLKVLGWCGLPFGTDTPTANGPNLTPSVVVCLVGAVWAFFCRCAAIFLSLCCIFFYSRMSVS